VRGALVFLLLLSACGPRQAPYRFRSPLLGSVSASPLPNAEADADEITSPAPVRRPSPRLATRQPPLAPRAADPSPPAPPVRRSIPSEAIPGDGDQLAGRLRDLVGRRDDTSSHLQVALAALRELGVELDPPLANVDDGPALVALAESRGALRRIEPAAPGESYRLGDLLVFDRVVGSDPASLVAVVVSVDDRGAIEFVYLARGVIRRGYVTPAAPSLRRDEAGRILNTFVRHSDGNDPSGTRHLAGDLLVASISLRQLLR
jgi:hypothetical protein